MGGGRGTSAIGQIMPNEQTLVDVGTVQLSASSGECGFIRVSHEGQSGFGKSKTRIEGLAARGEEFVELSRNAEVWSRVIERCTKAQACTIAIILKELRKEAERRMNAI